MVRDTGIAQYSVLWSGEDILHLLPVSLSVIVYTNLIHMVSFIHLRHDKAPHREQLGCNEIKRCKMKDVSSLLKSVQMHRMLRVIKWILIAWLCPEQHKRTHHADRRSPSPSLQRRKKKKSHFLFPRNDIGKFTVLPGVLGLIVAEKRECVQFPLHSLSIYCIKEDQFSCRELLQLLTI